MHSRRGHTRLSRRWQLGPILRGGIPKERPFTSSAYGDEGPRGTAVSRRSNLREFCLGQAQRTYLSRHVGTRQNAMCNSALQEGLRTLSRGEMGDAVVVPLIPECSSAHRRGRRLKYGPRTARLLTRSRRAARRAPRPPSSLALVYGRHLDPDDAHRRPDAHHLGVGGQVPARRAHVEGPANHPPYVTTGREMIQSDKTVYPTIRTTSGRCARRAVDESSYLTRAT